MLNQRILSTESFSRLASACPRQLKVVTTLEEANPSCRMPTPHSETRCRCTGRHLGKAPPFYHGCFSSSLGHRGYMVINRCLKGVFPVPKAANKQVSRADLHLLRPECAPILAHPGLSLAKQFPLRGAPHPLPAPRLPGSVHLVALPSSFLL